MHTTPVLTLVPLTDAVSRGTSHVTANRAVRCKYTTSADVRKRAIKSSSLVKDVVPSLISLMVSVDVKHHVYLLTYLGCSST